MVVSLKCSNLLHQRHNHDYYSYLNEEEVGSALREWLTRNPEMKREDIFITTKVWPHLMEPNDVEWSLKNSLENLGVDYVDAFLVHWPVACEKTSDNGVLLGKDGKVSLGPVLTTVKILTERLLLSMWLNKP